MEGFPVTARGGYDERMLFKIKINDPNLAKKIVLYRKKISACSICRIEDSGEAVDGEDGYINCIDEIVWAE